MRQLSFKCYRFPPDIIRHAIWLYARFTLSFRDVKEMLAERGLDVTYETIRRWFLKFGTVIAANLRRTRPRPSAWPANGWRSRSGALSHKLGWLQNEFGFRLDRCASFPSNDTASRPTSSAIRSGSTQGSL